MNGKLYMGTPIKAIFGKHYCITCGNQLQLKSYNRLIAKDSGDAKSYNYEGSGDFKVEWKKFYCPICNKSIECSTQTSYEKFLKLDKLTSDELLKHFKPNQISKTWIDSNGIFLEKLPIYDNKIINEVYKYFYFIEHGNKNYPLEVCTAQRKIMRERPLSIKKEKTYSKILSKIISIL